MARYLLGGLLVGLLLAYAGLSMLTFRPGSALPMALFFGPFQGALYFVGPYVRQFGFWIYLGAPVLYLVYAVLLGWSERRARLPAVTLGIFIFHYCGLLFSTQVLNLAAGEPRRFLLVMKNHGLVMALGFAVFIAANVITIIKGWIAKD